MISFMVLITCSP